MMGFPEYWGRTLLPRLSVMLWRYEQGGLCYFYPQPLRKEVIWPCDGEEMRINGFAIFDDDGVMIWLNHLPNLVTVHKGDTFRGRFGSCSFGGKRLDELE